MFFLLYKTTWEGFHTTRQQSYSSKVRCFLLLAISFSEHERMIPSPFLTTSSKICSSPKYLRDTHGQNLQSIGSVKSSGRKSPLCQYQGSAARRWWVF